MTGQTKSKAATESGEPTRIVIIGASVRPLIASCLSARCVPVAFDFFADWDGQQMIQASGCEHAILTKIDRYEDLLELDFSSLGDAVILSGGSELRSELVTVVSDCLPLLGPSARSLAAIADPLQWLQVLQDSGCRVPESRSELPTESLADWLAESSTDWLAKQRGTCGGSGVRILEKELAVDNAELKTNDSYFQKRIAGQAWSVVLASRHQETSDGNTTFSLGYTQQWLGSWSRQTSGRGPEVPQVLANPASLKSISALLQDPRPFAYHGSIGPLTVSISVQKQVDRIAKVLAQKFSMQGVWGMDFVLDANGQVWPVDFNPRITASAELFESLFVGSKSKFRSVLDLHLAACQSMSVDDANAFEKLAADRATFSGGLCEAKRIVFHLGPDPVKIDTEKWEQLSRYHVPNFFQGNQPGASIADVPRVGDQIETGRPLLTLRSRSKNEAAAIALLDDLFDAVQRCIGVC